VAHPPRRHDYALVRFPDAAAARGNPRGTPREGGAAHWRVEARTAPEAGDNASGSGCGAPPRDAPRATPRACTAALSVGSALMPAPDMVAVADARRAAGSDSLAAPRYAIGASRAELCLAARAAAAASAAARNAVPSAPT